MRERRRLPRRSALRSGRQVLLGRGIRRRPSTCDLAAPFEAPTLVRGLESRVVTSARLTPAETAVLLSTRVGCDDESCTDLARAERQTPSSPFGPTELLVGVNCPGTSEYWPTLSAGARGILFFESNRSADGGCAPDIARI